MPTIPRESSALLLIDFQDRLMPAISDAATSAANAGRLLNAARILNLPRLFTEQNPDRLGGTIAALTPESDEPALPKMSFDALGDPAIAARFQPERAIIVTGWEAHVCVLQTVSGLLSRGHPVHVVADAIGSRSPENRLSAIDRMRAMGADIVTTEMVVFEWLGSAAHPDFKRLVALIK